jgi:hypothetical protein
LYFIVHQQECIAWILHFELLPHPFDSRYEVSTLLADHIISHIFILIAILNKCGSWNIIKNSHLVRFHAKKYGGMKLLEPPSTYAK